MKIAARILSVATLMAVATFYMGCGPDPGPGKTEKEIQAEKLVFTWEVESVTFEGAPPALDHSDFKVIVTPKNGDKESVDFEVTGRPAGPSAWPASGTIEFGPNPKTQLVRKDATMNVDMNYQVSEGSLIIDFSFTGEPYEVDGRTRNVQGEWHFEFVKAQ